MAERSVGLIIFTEIPDIGLVAVLIERGWYNFEKIGPESWSGACQVTVHGKLEEGESFLTALRYEVEEELGSRFFNRLWDRREEMVEVFHLLTENKEVVTFAIKIDFNMFNLIRLHASSGAIRFLRPCEISFVHDLTDYQKKGGVLDRSVIAMFPDETEAVKRAFKHFLEGKLADSPQPEKEEKR